jgi:hypothetical protein
MKKFTIIFAALMLVCFAVPALAVDWNFYGNARMATFYESRDFGDGENAAGTDDKDTQTIWDLQGNSRIGANIKAENLKAQFEFGVSESNVSSRRIYGVWNFGAGQLKVGKDYTPVSQFISGQVFDGDLGLLGIGTAYGSRRGQIELAFGKFRIALIESTTGLINGMVDDTSTLPDTTVGTGGGFTFLEPGATAVNAFKGDVDDILPKLELGWGMAFDTWNFNLMGGAQYYCIEDVTSFKSPGSTDDVAVTSWIFGGDVGWNFGPGYLKAALSYGRNIGNAGWSIPSGVNGRSGTYQGGYAVWDGDDDTDDTDTFMGALVGGIKVSDMLSFEGGFGYRKDSTDGGAERDTEPMAFYVQSVIALAPGVYVIPEVGYYDLDDSADGADAGDLFYLGGKWQINF